MAVVGIVCEYNPFHLGHETQIRRIREMWPDAQVICLMSGNFVQRGEPAVFDKFTRARAACLCGADVVLELPLTKAISSAEGFAEGAVTIFERLGGVDYLCFGSETGEIGPIMETAKALLEPGFSPLLKEQLATGLSFPAARQKALGCMGLQEDVPSRPNDILAVEYCKALVRRDSAIKPWVIRREGDYHDLAIDPANPSASALRQAMEEDGEWLGAVPEAARMVFANAPQYAMTWGERAVLARLRAMSEEGWQAIPFDSEGLGNKIKKAVWSETKVADILTAAKSRRYAMTRLKRMLLCAYLGLTKEDMARPVSYVRVLAMAESGRSFLRRSRDEGTLTLVNAGESCPDREYENLELRAANLYTLFAREDADTRCGMERQGRIFHLKK